MDRSDPFPADPERMVRDQLEARGLADTAVLAAMRRIPRHAFVPEDLRACAYEDRPLPIGRGQTISQPLVVAMMTEALELTPSDRVLEIGTGSGYQTAVLAELAQEVWTIELEDPLQERARAVLAKLGYTHIHFRAGDGALGWPEAAPFDAIIQTCAARDFPPALRAQLAPNGRLLGPCGSSDEQVLVCLRRAEGGWTEQHLGGVRFVPLRRGS